MWGLSCRRIDILTSQKCQRSAVPSFVVLDLFLNSLVQIFWEQRPRAAPMTLTVHIWGVDAHVPCTLYKYSDPGVVPVRNFNAQRAKAVKSWAVSAKVSQRGICQSTSGRGVVVCFVLFFRIERMVSMMSFRISTLAPRLRSSAML